VAEGVEILLLFRQGCAVAVGVGAAHSYRRSGIDWFVLSVLISPLLGFLFLVAVGPKKATALGTRRSDSCNAFPLPAGWRCS
jgi:hypothetical protein